MYDRWFNNTMAIFTAFRGELKTRYDVVFELIPLYNDSSPSRRLYNSLLGSFINGQFIMITNNGGCTYAMRPQDLWKTPVYLSNYLYMQGAIFADGFYLAYGYFHTGSDMGGAIVYSRDYAETFTQRRLNGSYLPVGLFYIYAAMYHSGHFIFMSGRYDQPRVGFCSNPAGEMTVVTHPAPERVGDFMGLLYNGQHYVSCVAGWSSYIGYIAYTTDYHSNWSYTQISADRVQFSGVANSHGRTFALGTNLTTAKAFFCHAGVASGSWTYVEVPNAYRLTDILFFRGVWLAFGCQQIHTNYYGFGVFQAPGLSDSWTFTQMFTSSTLVAGYRARFMIIGSDIYVFTGGAGSGVSVANSCLVIKLK